MKFISMQKRHRSAADLCRFAGHKAFLLSAPGVVTMIFSGVMSKARPSPFAGDRRASVQVYFSNSFATSCSSCLMGRCWGQTRSHWPQRMQSEAREPGPVWTSS